MSWQETGYLEDVSRRTLLDEAKPHWGALIGAAVAAAAAYGQSAKQKSDQRRQANQASAEGALGGAGGGKEYESIAGQVPSVGGSGAGGIGGVLGSMGEPGSGPGGSGLDYRTANAFDAQRRAQGGQTAPATLGASVGAPTAGSLGQIPQGQRLQDVYSGQQPTPPPQQQPPPPRSSGVDYAQLAGQAGSLAGSLFQGGPTAPAVQPGGGYQSQPFTPSAYSYQDAMRRRRF